LLQLLSQVIALPGELPPFEGRQELWQKLAPLAFRDHSQGPKLGQRSIARFEVAVVADQKERETRIFFRKLCEKIGAITAGEARGNDKGIGLALGDVSQGLDATGAGLRGEVWLMLE
jgi:hypothetical protein